MADKRRRIGRGLAAGAFLLVAAGLYACGEAPPPSRSGSFAIEAFFDGASRSEGEIDTLFFWTEAFTADFVGRTEKGRLALDETFHFKPGDRLQSWALTALPDGRYEGTVSTEGKTGAMSDAVPVTGYRTADGAVLEYDGYAPGGGGWRLHFRHWMVAGTDGTVLNRVRISKFGIPLAGASVVFSRVPPAT